MVRRKATTTTSPNHFSSENRTTLAGKWSGRIAIFLGAIALSTCNVEMKPQTDKAAAEAPSEGPGVSLFAARPDRRWRLPTKLAEVSGLAVTRDGRLFGHGDETGVVYELDIETGRIAKNFALGRPIVRGDFEGIAVLGDDFYLVTSAGQLYRFPEGGNGEHVTYESFDTGLSRICEIEGLTASRDSLIIACKSNYGPGMRNAVAFYAWRPGAAAATPWKRADALVEAMDGRVHPSGIDIDARSGRIVVIAARERVLGELNPDGSVAAARRLDDSHLQAEGVAIMPDGALVIADEAAGARAIITRYPRR